MDICHELSQFLPSLIRVNRVYKERCRMYFCYHKGRWRFLKIVIHLHCMGTDNSIWLTCCALHNILLEVDGMNVLRNDVFSYQ